ncbi:hypothetical protein EDC01DRAFT_634838 [Geopyxis carbonaria]|nr:hypothetical protein EDC01DRAFT_634838 [Geopyxis carbonaria]
MANLKFTESDNIILLLSCIRHTTNGIPDWKAIATELDPSLQPRAFSRRYQRLVGLYESGEISPSPGKKTVVKEKGVKKAKGGRGGKKRKLEPAVEYEDPEEEDDEVVVKNAEDEGEEDRKTALAVLGVEGGSGEEE